MVPVAGRRPAAGVVVGRGFGDCLGVSYLSAVAHADACVNGTVKRGGSGGDYFSCQSGAWLHVVPTFDPNSADGYGPNQPLPPLCVEVSGPVHVPDGWASAWSLRRLPKAAPTATPGDGIEARMSSSSGTPSTDKYRRDTRIGTHSGADLTWH